MYIDKSGGKMNQKQINQMMKQAQKMQSDMESAQKEIENRTFTATAGGSAVKVMMKGNKIIESIDIQKDVIDPEDKEMLEEMIILAVNNAIKEITETTDKEMASFTNGLPF